jgi:hypothetical protein
MVSTISFALSIYNYPFEEKVELLSSWVLQYPQCQQQEIFKLIFLVYEPQITVTWTYGRLMDGEVMHVQVTEDTLFLKMDWFEFEMLAFLYKNRMILGSEQAWQSWYTRIRTTRLLLCKDYIHANRFTLFPNQSSYLLNLSWIYSEIQKNEYGKRKLKQCLQDEIQRIIHKVNCVHKLRMHWAAIKIQKLYRQQSCIECNARFYKGFGPFCNKQCMENHVL